MLLLLLCLAWFASFVWWRRSGAAAAWVVGALIGTAACTEGIARLWWGAAVSATSSARSVNAWTIADHGVSSLQRLPIPTALLPMDGRTLARGDRPRMLFIGDSFTAGEGVGPGEDLPAQVAVRRPEVEVLNHGLSGTSFSTQGELYERYGAAWQPDAVVWVFILNDLGSASPAPALRAAGLTTWDDGVVDRTREGRDPGWSVAWDVVQLARARRAAGAIVEQAYRDGYDPARSADELAWLRRRLGELVAATRERGASFTFVIYPLLVDLDAYPFAAAHQTLADVAREAGAEVVDLLPVFAGEDASRLWASPEDHHPNAGAHARAADLLAPRITVPAARAGCPRSSPAGQAWCAAPGPATALALAHEAASLDERAARAPFEPRKITAVALHAAAALGDDAVRAEVEAAARGLVGAPR